MRSPQLNPHIVNYLASKLGKEKTTITQQISLLKRRFPGLPSNAVAQLYAHQKGYSVLQKLNKEEKASLSNVNVDIVVDKQQSVKPAKNEMNKTVLRQRTIQISKEFQFSSSFLKASKISEAKEMAAIYPFLYVLENSIRSFISFVYEKNVGKDWWNTLQINKNIKDKVSGHMKREQRNMWHQRRGATELDYLDLIDLKYFIRFKPDFFIPIYFERIEWFNEFIEEVYMSRCVLCHMNPLESNNIKALEVKFRQWNKLVEANQPAEEEIFLIKS